MQENEEISKAIYGFTLVFIVVICERFTYFVRCNRKKMCITVFHSSLHDTNIPQGLQCISELNCSELN